MTLQRTCHTHAGLPLFCLFAKYSSLPGEGGAIFRDSDEARGQAKLYRELEADAWRACGLGAPS